MLEGIVVGSLSPGVLLLYFGIVLISWGYLNSLSLFMNRPEGIRVVNCSSLTLGKWFSTLDYLLRAKSIITKAYKEVEWSPSISVFDQILT
ncbi:unnamed protein product [Clonostachys rosea f. rosea IK726]|uniref:Uncharacterized protein n=1 Tax=Clonostachys rosea f. rosea IK726 TaxID=1349383 RepID=A0ACA9UL04_BIOOC|nr:unnamed protein product [Clonostachys rosea f. rosea IK726]